MSQNSLGRKSTAATRLLAVVAMFAMVLTACGSDDASTVSAGTSAAPETTEVTETTEATETTETTDAAAATDETGADGHELVAETPSRIVSLSPSSTEILFVIGAGEQVVAVDSFSNYPEGTPVTDLSAFEPSLEAIIGYEPDLVVLSYDPGEIVAGLEQAGVKTVLHPAAASLEDVYIQVAELGVATGRMDEAAALDASMRADLAAIVESVPADGGVSVYHEVDNTFYSASSASFIGEIYTMLGITNIADEADPDGYGYPQLSPEYIIEANPSLIVMTDQGGYTAEDLAARPGWDVISAVSANNILVANADEASRWGPRVVNFAKAVADQAAVAAAG